MRSKLHQDPLPASNTAARWGRASRHTRERCSHLFGSPSQRESQLEYRRLPRGSAPQRPSATVALGGSPAARSQNRSALTLQIRPRVLKDSLVAEPGFRMFATRSATCLGYNRLWVGRNVDCDRLTTAGFLRRAPISCQTATGPTSVILRCRSGKARMSAFDQTGRTTYRFRTARMSPISAVCQQAATAHELESRIAARPKT